MFKGFKSTHSGRLERFLDAKQLQEVSKSMVGWYGPPIALAGVPGSVFATGDGDFIGEVRNGYEANYLDYAKDVGRRIQRAARIASGRKKMRLDAGFASLSDLVSEATTGGKRQDVYFSKSGQTGVAGAANTMWYGAGMPAAGAAGSAAPGGRVPSRATTGSLQGWANAGAGDTLHLVSAALYSNVVAPVIMYDRIFDVAKTMNSTAAEAVTGVPTRYQSTNPANPDFIGGNFLTIETQTVLAATAHNWTPCTYRNQANVASTLPSVTGISGCIAGRIDIAAQPFYTPLEAGDSGIKALTNMQCSAAVATGAINFMIGHPLAWMVNPIANSMVMFDFVNTAFNLVRIYDDACIAFLEPVKPATTAATISGSIICVSG